MRNCTSIDTFKVVTTNNKDLNVHHDAFFDYLPDVPLDLEVDENSFTLKASHFSNSSRIRISVLLKISAHDGR